MSVCLRLPAAPGGKPVILAAHNTSATSVRLRWRPLTAEQLRGEFQAYRITYRERNGTDDSLREVRIRDELTQVRGGGRAGRRGVSRLQVTSMYME